MLQQASFLVSTKLALSNERPEIRACHKSPHWHCRSRHVTQGFLLLSIRQIEKKGDYVLVRSLIQFIPVMQSTPNSQSSHNCPFRLSQTKMCCWIQVSFSSQIKILCDLHNLFNTDPHPDPSFTSPFFCQQQNISSLKTDLQPRQMIRQPERRRVESKVYFRPIRRKPYAEHRFHDRESLRCDRKAQQSYSQWWKGDKMA